MTDNVPRCSNCRSPAEEWTIIGGRLLCWECAESDSPFSPNPIPKLVEMVEKGLTAQQILDWWLVKKEGLTEAEWAEKRNVTVQTVNERVNQACDTLEDDCFRL